MPEFLIFIDTEASCLPKDWNLPYSALNNWPYALQVSWLIYTGTGEKIKVENHYIDNNDFEIDPSSQRIHGLTKAFLRQNGIPRKELLGILSKDLNEYKPMIIGHFTELDYRIIGADYYREEMDNPMENLQTFCIMIASKHLQQNPQYKYLRLGNLFELLFKKPLLNQHNALVDATATADCFFELVKRKAITSLIQPPIEFQKKQKISTLFGWIVVLLLIVFSALLIVFYYE